MLKPKVVVGVDGSRTSIAALHAAVEEARLRGAPLRVVTVWQLTYSEIAIETPTVVRRIVEHNARILETALASIATGERAGVDITSELLNGHSTTELLAAASDATLLVVGTRGTSGVTGTVLGSVAHAAVHHAKCPFLVVPYPGAHE